MFCLSGSLQDAAGCRLAATCSSSQEPSLHKMSCTTATHLAAGPAPPARPGSAACPPASPAQTGPAPGRAGRGRLGRRGPHPGAPAGEGAGRGRQQGTGAGWQRSRRVRWDQPMRSVPHSQHPPTFCAKCRLSSTGQPAHLHKVLQCLVRQRHAVGLPQGAQARQRGLVGRPQALHQRGLHGRQQRDLRAHQVAAGVAGRVPEPDFL